MDLSLQDIEQTYNFARSQRPIRIKRLSVVARLVEEMLAAMLAGFGYPISSTKQSNGSNSFDLGLVQEFQETQNPLRRILGNDRVQEALQVVIDAKETMNRERTSQQSVQSFIQNYEVAIPELRAAVASCKANGEYDSGDNAEPGPQWAGTTLPSQGGDRDLPQGGPKYKPNTGWSGTSLPS